MQSENFRAGVQYDDFKGTAAADCLDLHSFDRYLQDQGLIQPNEFLAGVKMGWGSPQGATKIVSVTGLLAESAGYDGLTALVETGEPLVVRSVQINVPLEDFFGWFKRFEIAVSRKGELDGREISIR